MRLIFVRRSFTSFWNKLINTFYNIFRSVDIKRKKQVTGLIVMFFFHQLWLFANRMFQFMMQMDWPSSFKVPAPRITSCFIYVFWCFDYTKNLTAAPFCWFQASGAHWLSSSEWRILSHFEPIFYLCDSCHCSGRFPVLFLQVFIPHSDPFQSHLTEWQKSQSPSVSSF